MAWLYVPRPEQLNRSQRPSTRSQARSVIGESNLQFRRLSSPVVARTPRGPRKGRCQVHVAEQSFGMFPIHIHAIVFKLSSVEKEERKKGERKKMNKIEVFMHRFLECDKGYQNFCSRFSNRIAKGCTVVYKRFAFVCFVFMELLLYLMYRQPFKNLGDP